MPTAVQAPVLQQQLLYSVYVHSSRLNFTDFEPGSVFHGTLVAAQGRAAWGDTTPAVRILLEESLKDYMNHLFVLLSDSDIPLYPAKLTYTQLIQVGDRGLACLPGRCGGKQKCGVCYLFPASQSHPSEHFYQ